MKIELHKYLIEIRLQKMSVKPNTITPPSDKERLRSAFVKKKIFIVGLFGILLILGGLILEHHYKIFVSENSTHYARYCHMLEYAGFFLRDIGIAAAIAALIGTILEYPSVTHLLRNSIIDALIDYKHLESLTLPQIERVKEKATELVWRLQGRKNDHDITRNRLQLEQDLIKVLEKPFYEKYDMIVVCKDVEEDGFKYVHRTIRTDYTLVNPMNTRATVALFNYSVIFQCPINFNPELLIRPKRLEIIIDGNSKETLIPKIEMEKTKVEGLTSRYNIRCSYTELNKKTGVYEPIIRSFDNMIEVSMEEERAVVNDDSIYTKKIDFPTKSFALDFSYSNNDYFLKADCFGHAGVSLYKGDFDIINVGDSNQVRIKSSKRWLFPGNGVYVAILPSQTENNYDGDPLEAREKHITGGTTSSEPKK